MDYSILETDLTCHVQAKGTLTFDDHDTTKQLIAELSSGASRDIHVDLADVTMIDSAGIGLLMRLADEMKSTNRHISLHNPQGATRKILEIARLNEVLDIHT